jgi:hypothetical protein
MQISRRPFCTGLTDFCTAARYFKPAADQHPPEAFRLMDRFSVAFAFTNVGVFWPISPLSDMLQSKIILMDRFQTVQVFESIQSRRTCSN